MAKPDLSFVRGGRPLHEWLPEVVSPDPRTSRRAADALAAMFHALPSVHTDFEEIEGELPTGHEHTDAWRREVRAAIERPEFPRRAFFNAAAKFVVRAHADWVAAIDASVESETVDVVKDAECDERAAEAFSMASLVIGWAIESAGPALLDAPEALWMLLESRGHAFLAIKALADIGPPAAPQFLDWLMSRFEQAEGPWINEHAALVSVARGDPRLLVRVMEILEAAVDRPGEPLAAGAPDFHRRFYRDGKVWPAATVLRSLDGDVRAARGGAQRVVSTLLRLTRSPHPGRRAAAAYALGPVAKGLDAGATRPVVDRLVELTADYPWVAGRAIDALGELCAAAGRVVPRLVELFDAFDEFDPDAFYGGEHSRVCTALASFGAAAAPAVPRLARYLDEWLARPDSSKERPVDVLGLLASIGPAAADALPLLERWRAEGEGKDDPLDPVEPLDAAILAIRR